MKKLTQCSNLRIVAYPALLASILLLSGCAETVKERPQPTPAPHVVLIPGQQVKIVDQSWEKSIDDLPQGRMPREQLKTWAKQTLHSDDSSAPNNVLSFIIYEASLTRVDPPAKEWVMDPGPSKYTINYAVRLVSQGKSVGKEIGHVEVKVEEIRYVPHGASEYRRTSELEDGISAAIGKLDRELTQKARTYLGAR